LIKAARSGGDKRKLIEVSIASFYSPITMAAGSKIAAFYQFSPLSDLPALQDALLGRLNDLGIKGSVLLAHEGINGTIAGEAEKLDTALSSISNITGCSALHPKFSFSNDMPFRRMKVRLKKEIVTIGPVKANPNEKVGTYVSAQDWNALIDDPDVILIDTRNSYEFKVGSFKGAIDPGTESFGEFPEFVRQSLGNAKHKKIAMFCTGGIRCEKASSFMLNEGFTEVYHLKGGILKYLEDVRPEESLWNGACFVFDERVAVGHQLKIADFTTCHGCLMPVSAEERTSPLYEEGVCCPSCAERLTDVQKASSRERQRQVDLGDKRGKKHLGPV
jgi:UPF0176 protein